MAKRTTEAYISQMEKTSAYWKKKADREYAYAKNSNDGYHMQRRHIQRLKSFQRKQRTQDFMAISGGDFNESAEVL